MKFNWPKTDLDFDLKEQTILMGLGGSRSYGTHTEKSDTDYRGILVPPKEYYLSPFKGFEQTQWKGEGETGRVSEISGVIEADEEGTVFGIQKFTSLASKCNPNVIEILFVDDDCIVYMTEEGKLLRDNREIFLSEIACKTFTGYAMNQLRRIRTHKAWIDSPPKKQPVRKDFGLPPEKIIRPDQIQAAESFIERNVESFAPWLLDANGQASDGFWEGVGNIVSMIVDQSNLEYNLEFDTWVEVKALAKELSATQLGFDDNFIEYLKNEKAYARARQHYKQYQAWLKNRNPARAELEARYGYDCKHAMHLVRLLRMGEEIIRTGELKVYRPDREELIRIRNGAWAYDDLVEWAKEREQIIYQLVNDGKAAVPKVPNYKKIEELTIEIQEKVWNRSK